MGRTRILVSLLLLVAASAQAQATGGTEVSVGTITVSQTGHDREEFMFLRLLGWGRSGRFGLDFRAEASGMPGSFNHEDPGTYRSARVGFAADWDLIHVQDAACGVMVGAEYSVILETKDGETPTTPRPATFGAGFTCRYRGARAKTLAGPNQSLRGAISSTTVVHVPSGWSSWTVEAALGEHQEALIMISVSAKFDFGGKR